MWNSTALKWPATTSDIQTGSESITDKIDTEMNSAVERLMSIEGEADFQRHPLGVDADALLSLRASLENLLVQGQVLTATPYQFQVGEKQSSGCYLNPQKAVEVITTKLRDQVDKNRPTGQLYCVAIMVSESQLNRFSLTLSDLTKVLVLPEWCQVARQATALSTIQVDKYHQPANIVQPRFKPQVSINANPLRALLYHQGSQLATLESLANDNANVIDKLKALANKRSEKLDEIKLAINTLKNVSGNVYSMALAGNCESIATQLKQATLPTNNQHTIMSLLLSPQPLTFFEKLLCSV